MSKNSKEKNKKRISARESSANKTRASTLAKRGQSGSSSSSSSKAPTVNYTFDARRETASQYNARIEKERAAVAAFNSKRTETPSEATARDRQKAGGLDMDALMRASEFKTLSADEQEVVKAIYLAIGENNTESAGKLVAAFRAAEKMADPYWKQQLRLASDALERGFVAIDQELEFEEKQKLRNLEDLRADIASRQEFLTLEEQNDLRAIERDYKQTIDTTRQNLAATGKTSSSQRAQTETLIEEATGDLRESRKRSFAMQREDAANQLLRGERDTQSELERLRELAKTRRLDLARQGEERLGSGNLPSLSGYSYTPLGDIYGSINEDRQTDIITAAKNMLF